MGLKVSVIGNSKNRVSINNQNRATIRTVGIAPSDIRNSFTGLSDVDASGASDNDVVVYDAATQKFVVEELPVVNGGTF